MPAQLDTAQRRIAFAKRLNDIAHEIAQELGVEHVAIVSFVKEGKSGHILEGGTGTMDFTEVFRALLRGREAQAQQGESDVHLLKS